jgi:hypothetical protein
MHKTCRLLGTTLFCLSLIIRTFNSWQDETGGGGGKKTKKEKVNINDPQDIQDALIVDNANRVKGDLL